MSWTLNDGDCLDVVTGLASLADRSVDVVITDPPYSERVHARLGLEDRNDGATARDALTFECITAERASHAAREFVRLSRSWILIFCDEVSLVLWKDSLEAAGAEYVRKGTWVKSAPMPQMSGDRPCVGTEEIVIAHSPRPPKSGRMQWNGGGRPATYTYPSQEPGIARRHPNQKPIALMEAIIRDFSNPGAIVLDPYTGSGSTGVAAIRCGRSFVGWERAAATVVAARTRLHAAREQLDLFAGGREAV